MKSQILINNRETARAIMSLLFRQTVKEILYNIVIYENYQARCKFEQFLKSKDKITIPDILEYKGNPIGTIKVLDILELRKDEKFVTEKAYDNPKIVEDIVREVATLLKANKYVQEFKISCENFESIHTHNAFSEIQMKNGRN